jgi:hypothetical protein
VPVPHVDVERDMCALTSESYGDGFANASARASDENNLV